MRTTAVLGLLVLLCAVAVGSAFGAVTTGSASFKGDKGIELTFSVPVDDAWAKKPENLVVYEKPDPDIRISPASIAVAPNRTKVTLTFKDALNTAGEYVVEAKDVSSEGKVVGSTEFLVKKGHFQVLFGLFLGASLIANYVFTKFLGLCIFFGVSQKKDTAVGMGATFTLVMVLSAVFCWALFTYVLTPLHLDFLQIIVFIGTVAIFVQFADTVLRKVNPYLFKKLGVYLVLIVTNCIILAVPLENVLKKHGAAESLIFALGAGLGFALALFLMACVREKLEVCRVPAVFKGLPIAFVVAGLFALAFLGFSGLVIF
ncbi:MAG: Rnf-Nqr domain containing protein [Thermodesulfobacteriota bacterium]